MTFNNWARSTAAEVRVQELHFRGHIPQKAKREKRMKMRGKTSRKRAVSLETSSSGQTQTTEGVTSAQAATGELPTQTGGNLQGSLSTDRLHWDSSLICRAQLGSMAKAALLKHTEFIKNLKKL